VLCGVWEGVALPDDACCVGWSPVSDIADDGVSVSGPLSDIGCECPAVRVLVDLIADLRSPYYARGDWLVKRLAEAEARVSGL